MKPSQDKTYMRRRKWISGMSLFLFVALIAFLSVFFTKILAPYLNSTEQLRAFLDVYGWKGRFILLGLQCVQVVVALIPGEVIELGAGYAYGAIEGTLLCFAGIAISSSLIFLLVKKWGVPMVELFVSREKISHLRIFNSSKKMKRLVFLLFLIPGTPKDVLTYFAGLTDLRLHEFLVISMIARVPSVLSSTFSGQMVGDKNFITAGIVYAVTGALSVLGYVLYNRILNRKETE